MTRHPAATDPSERKSAPVRGLPFCGWFAKT